MTTRTARLWLSSVLLTPLVVSLAFASGTDVGSYLLLPGALIAWPVWPEGIHTHRNPVSGVVFYFVFLAGNIVVWSILFRLLLGLIFPAKGNREPVRQ